MLSLVDIWAGRPSRDSGGGPHFAGAFIAVVRPIDERLGRQQHVGNGVKQQHIRLRLDHDALVELRRRLLGITTPRRRWKRPVADVTGGPKARSRAGSGRRPSFWKLAQDGINHVPLDVGRTVSSAVSNVFAHSSARLNSCSITAPYRCARWAVSVVPSARVVRRERRWRGRLDQWPRRP
jgi:hypothetical protein